VYDVPAGDAVLLESNWAGEQNRLVSHVFDAEEPGARAAWIIVIFKFFLPGASPFSSVHAGSAPLAMLVRVQVPTPSPSPPSLIRHKDVARNFFSEVA
jgi:hypothetical protein